MIHRVALFVLILLTILTSGCSGSGNPIVPGVVTFNDPGLDAVIRTLISKPSGNILQTDIVNLTEIDASARGISDLSGLEYCFNLQVLVLKDNQITDLTPLQGPAKLNTLLLCNNQISDINPLSGLLNLTELRLLNNPVSEIGAVQGLVNLRFLCLSNCQISDIAPIVNNPGLGPGDTVGLVNNPLNDEAMNVHIPALEARGVQVVLVM